MARAVPAAAPRAPRLLAAALLLVLLAAACQRAEGDTGRFGSRGWARAGAHPGTAPLIESSLPAGAPVVSELRCQCLQTSQGIHPKNIQSVKVTPAGPHCAQIEVM